MHAHITHTQYNDHTPAQRCAHVQTPPYTYPTHRSTCTYAHKHMQTQQSYAPNLITKHTEFYQEHGNTIG